MREDMICLGSFFIASTGKKTWFRYLHCTFQFNMGVFSYVLYFPSFFYNGLAVPSTQ